MTFRLLLNELFNLTCRSVTKSSGLYSSICNALSSWIACLLLISSQVEMRHLVGLFSSNRSSLLRDDYAHKNV